MSDFPLWLKVMVVTGGISRGDPGFCLVAVVVFFLLLLGLAALVVGQTAR